MTLHAAVLVTVPYAAGLAAADEAATTTAAACATELDSIDSIDSVGAAIAPVAVVLSPLMLAWTSPNHGLHIGTCTEAAQLRFID